MAIINEQKLNWAWDERVFYVYTDGDIVELSFQYKDNGYNYYGPPRIKKRNLLYKVIAKSKVDHLLTVQTGKLTYKK